MNFLELKLTKRLKVFESALYCNLGYLLLVLILKGIQGLVVKGGDYSTVFGMIEFIVAALYWLLFNCLLKHEKTIHHHFQKRKVRYAQECARAPQEICTEFQSFLDSCCASV